MDKLITVTALSFYILAMAGIVFHVVLKWSKKEIEGSPADWFRANPQATVYSMLTVYGAVVGLIAAGQVTDINNLMQVIAVFGIGYVGDSAVNKQ